jgi:ERO1-like protein alpha
MARILSSPELLNVCAGPFDVARMWKGDSGPLLREQLRGHFQNITSIMDCVGCEKCKLWGKLQFLGVATSLKILFASNDCFEQQLSPRDLLRELQLERNEVIALVNLLSKLSQSVAVYRDMSTELLMKDGITPCFLPSDSIT